MPFSDEKFQLSGIEDPAPKWRYILLLPRINGYEPPATLVSDVDMTYAHVNFNEQFQGSQYISFPSFEQSPTLSCTFHEKYDFSLKQYFKDWQELIVDPVGYYWRPRNEYIKPIVLQQYDVMGKLQCTSLMEECIPNGAISESLSQDSNYISYTMEFSVNFIKVVRNAGTGGAAP